MKPLKTFGHQGDLNFKRIEVLPKGNLIPLKEDEERGGITLALGEHTNHAHTLIAPSKAVKISAFAFNGKQYIVVEGGNAILRHGTFVAPGKIKEEELDKHNEIIMPPGFYEQGNEEEYDPFLKQIRKVVD